VNHILTEIKDSMLKGNQLILINAEDDSDKNPVYRVLVQTPGELDYPEYGITVNYPSKGIEEAMKSLDGLHVKEEPNEHERALGVTPPPFGEIMNTGYCPEYGGYVDIEVYNDGYKPVFERMKNNLENGRPVRNKFSTELAPLDPKNPEDYMIKTGENKYDLNKWKYTALEMTNRARDKKTGLCSVLVNSKDFKGDDKVTDEIKLEYNGRAFASYEDFANFLKGKYEELQDKYQKGKALYDNLKPEDFKEYQELKAEEKALREQLVPVWTAAGEQKLELVNSLIEKLPEDEQKAAKERFEKMDIADLKLVNSFGTGEPPEPAPGVTARGAGGNQNTRMTKEEKENKEIMDKLENMGYFK